MIIQLISIGEELLSGSIVDSNAQFIAGKLFARGYKISKKTTLPDHPQKLMQGLREALEASDLVIATGGLGPTVDDVTLSSAAELYRRPLCLDKTLLKSLGSRFGKGLGALNDQAKIPEGAEILPNSVGTASGCILSGELGTLILLPGVPEEMRPMLEEHLIPYLEKQFPLHSHLFRKSVHLFEISESQADPLVVGLKQKYPEASFGIYPGLGTLKITMAMEAEEERIAEEKLQKIHEEILQEFGSFCFESSSGTIQEAVCNLFTKNGWTLSVAESCTGGQIAATIVQVPGASKFFLGSLVSYANSLKTQLLGVKESSLNLQGAVSEEVVCQMAEGVQKLTNSDFSLASSGIAGPSGGQPDKPVGTVFCALSGKNRPTKVWKLHFPGTRPVIIQRTVNFLLGRLLFCDG